MPKWQDGDIVELIILSWLLFCFVDIRYSLFQGEHWSGLLQNCPSLECGVNDRLHICVGSFISPGIGTV